MVDEKKTISRSAFLVSLGGLISLVVGLGSQIIIAMQFGAGAEMDAYLTALAIPIYIQAVLLSGLSFVFIPAFVEARASGKEEEAWSMVGTFFWLVGSILIVLAIVGFAFAPTIISISAPGLNPEKADLAARILGIIIFTIPLSGFAVLTSGVQNARNRFFSPAVAGAAASLGMIVALLLLQGQIGAMALAWGYLFGVLLQATITTIPVLHHGWEGGLSLGDDRIKEMIRLITPLIIFGILTRATPIIERYYASGLSDGELSYLGYSAKISRIFQALLVASIATVIFPVMSNVYSKYGHEELKETIQHGLNLTLAVGLPILAIITAVAVPFVKVLFERGTFREGDTLQVARVLPIILVGTILIPMVGNIFARTFYVKKDTLTVPMVSVISIIIYFFLARALVKNLGFIGLATSQLIYALIGILLLSILLNHKFRIFRLTNTIKSFSFYAGLSLVAFIIATLLIHLLTPFPSWMQLGIAVILSGTVYLLALYWIDPKITNAILELAGVHHILRITRKLTSLGRAKVSPVK